MPSPILAVSAALHLVAAAASGVPSLDVRPSCRAAAATEIEATDRMQACVGSEQAARGQLVKKWTTYAPADRFRCVEQMVDFDPSYTELLTCLDMANDAAKLPAELY